MRGSEHAQNGEAIYNTKGGKNMNMNVIRNWLVAVVGLAAFRGVCNDIYITDAAYGGATLTVNGGDILHVQGNGLTADTSVTVNGGIVQFENTATISSPITYAGIATNMTSSSSVTGTLAGVVTVNAHFFNRGAGGIVWQGGGIIQNGADFHVDGGSFHIISNTVEVAANSNGQFLMENDAEWFCIRDKGIFLLRAASSNSGVRIAVAKGRTGVFEIAKGGLLQMYNKRQLIVGFRAQSTNIFRINGGQFSDLHYGAPLYLSSLGNANVTGRFEFLSGDFYQYSHWRTANANTVPQEIDWRGGVWHMANSGNYASSLVNSSAVRLNVNGPDCILDVGGVQCTNRYFESGNILDNAQPMTFGPNGRLTVCGNANVGSYTLNSKIVDGRIVMSNKNIVVTQDVAPLRLAQLEPETDKVLDLEFDDPWTIGTVKLTKKNEGCAYPNASVENVRIITGADWDNGLFSFASVSNMTFDAGSVLSVTVAADGSVPSLGLLGDLTFPDAMNFSVVRNGNYSSGTIVLSAAGSVSGGTTMTPAAGSDKAKMSVNAAARLVSLVKSGCVYIFR